MTDDTASAGKARSRTDQLDTDTTDDLLEPADEDAIYVDSLTATFSAIASAEADEIHASGSAIGSATAGSLTATASAIGLANIDGDAHISVSAVPIVRTTGGATFSQAYASAVLVGGELQVHQAAAPVMVGKTLAATQVGAGVVVTGDAEITRSTIGLLLSRSANVSDDSRVLLSTKGALIIAAALFGGFAFVAIAMIVGAQRVSQWRPDFSLPELPEWPWKRSE